MLTPKQKKVRDFYASFIKKRGYSPSLEEAAKRLRSSKSAVHEIIQRLQGKGELDKQYRRSRSVNVPSTVKMIQVPLLGTIAAGQPLTLFDTPTETIAVPASRIPKSGKIYALRVQGESMVEENIDEGDIVLIRQQPVAENGQKIVALIDNSEATIKKFYDEGERIRLQPANKTMKPIIIKKDEQELSIQGIFIDVIKRENTRSRSLPTYPSVVKTERENSSVRKVIYGDAVLYHADCVNAFKKLAANSVDLIATDPPYFLDGMDSEWSDTKLKQKAARAGTIQGLPVGMKFDPEQGKRLEIFFTRVSREALRVLKPGGFMISFSQGRLFHRLALAAENAGFEVRDLLTWEHNGGQGKAFTQTHFVKKMRIPDREKERIIKSLGNRKTPQLRPKFEALLLAQKPKEGTFVENWMKWHTGLIKTDFETQQTTVFQYKKPNARKLIDHMTIKPLDLMERLIEIFSVRGQVVLDPFMGSGTTGVAALRKERKFMGFEIEEKYFTIAGKRLREHGKA